MRRATITLGLLLALLGTESAAAELRYGTAFDGVDANPQGIGDIAQLDGGYDPADGSIAVSVAFRDGAPASFPFALYRGRVVKRGDDCERRGRGPAFRGTIRIRTSPYSLPSSGTLAGNEITGQTFVTEGGLRVTATFADPQLVNRGYRCIVVGSPVDRAELFFAGFEPRKPARPEPKPEPKPEPRLRLTPRTAAGHVVDVLAGEFGKRRARQAKGRYIGCPRSAFTKVKGKRAAFCLFRLALGSGRAVAGTVAVQIVKNRFRDSGFQDFRFKLGFTSCAPGVRAGGLLSCDQAFALARQLQSRGLGRHSVVVGGERTFRGLLRFECRVAAQRTSCANGLGDRVVYTAT